MKFTVLNGLVPKLEDRIEKFQKKLAKYGEGVITYTKSEPYYRNAATAGNGIAIANAGYDSNKYWLTMTNKEIDGDYSNYSDDVYQFEHLYKKKGGSATAASGYGGGGGASNWANGGDGGIDSHNSGWAGTLGSGVGGGYRDKNTDGGSGGLPYIFFCSNIDFSIEKK